MSGGLVGHLNVTHPALVTSHSNPDIWEFVAENAVELVGEKPSPKKLTALLTDPVDIYGGVFKSFARERNDVRDQRIRAVFWNRFKELTAKF